MRRTILIVSFISATFVCWGQSQYLEPVKDFKEYEGDLKAYYDSVFPLLYKGFSEKPTARFTSMPSFSSEYSFSIETIDGKSYVVSNSLSESYWYAKNKKNVKVISNKAELIRDLYLKVVDLFALLAEQTKTPANDLMRLDGVTYYFATTGKDGQIKIGETWSPGDKSLLGRLIKICNKLYSVGKRNKISQTDLLNEVDKLLKDLQ